MHVKVLARSARWLLLAFLVSMIPATSHAGVFISVGFAPPPLLVYDQPLCPEPGLMWTPGYWAYGPDGYYWVPGAWVPAPYEGALWTPGYWGWGSGLYMWHPGYWGAHVGYYGGVNYGFGYMGIGFVGGEWRGGRFAYNSAVMHVGYGGVWGNRVYADRAVIGSHIVVNNHVAFSGGPGGINHLPTAQERGYMNERHMGPTGAQSQHMQAAMGNHGAYYNVNHGHPAQTAVSRPLTAGGRNGFQQNRGGANSFQGGRSQGYQPQSRTNQGYQQQHQQNQYRPQQQARPQQQQARPESHQQSRPAPRGEDHSQPRGGESHDHR